MMIRSKVYTVLIGDHVVDLPSSILEQHIVLRDLDIYPRHNTQKAWPTSNSVLQISFFSILNAFSRETNTFQGVTWPLPYYLMQ